MYEMLKLFLLLFSIFFSVYTLTYSQKVLWETGVSGEYAMLSPNGDVVATVGSRIISLWDWKNKTIIRNIRNHSNRVMQLSFSPNSKTVASISRDTTIAFHSLEDLTSQIITVPSETWLESGSYSASGNHYLVVNRAFDLFVYDASTKRLIYVKKEFLLMEGQPLSLSADGETMVTSSDFISIERYNLRTNVRDTLKLSSSQELITSIQYSPDNSTVAITTNDGKAALYSSNTFELISSIGTPKDTIVAFRWGNSTKKYSWVTTNGFVVVSENGSRKFIPYVEDFTLENIVVDNEQKTLFTYESDGTVRLFSVEDGMIQEKISHFVQSCFSIEFLDSKTILSIQLDGSIIKHSVENGKELQRVKKYEGGWFKLSNNNELFVQYGGSVVSVYETKNLEVKATHTFDIDIVTGAAWAENNSKLYISGSDGFIRILTVSTLKCIDSFQVSDKAISACTISQNEEFLSVVCDDLSVKIISIKSQSVTDSYSKNNGRQVSTFFSDNDRYIYNSSVTGFVWKWKRNTSEGVSVFPEPNQSIVAMKPSNSNKTLLTSTISGNIRFWDMNTFQVYHTIENNSVVTSLATSEDGSLLVTAFADGTIKLWDVEGILK